MIKLSTIFAFLLLFTVSAFARNSKECASGEPFRDIYADTWVATDGIGRTMPDHGQVGDVKNDQRRIVGIFYITWHLQDKKNRTSPYQGDVSKVLAADPSVRFDANHKLWKEPEYHWGEPEMGYFLSQDRYVIRKDMSMLSDAGVDVLIMDVTNAVHYWDEWDVTFSVMQQMLAEGNKVPKFCFWSFNGPSITVVQKLYDRIYKEQKYKDLWFYWDNKPLLLYNSTPSFDANRGGITHPNPNYDPAAATDPNHPHYRNPEYSEKFYADYTKDVKSFFTLRTMWWGYYEWGNKRFVGTEDNWSFGYSLGDPKVESMKPEELLSLHNGKREQAAVTTAQHPVTMNPAVNMGVGKSWSRANGQPKLNDQDLPEPTYVPWLGKTVQNPEGYGIYFQERWDEALASNPEFLYINDWNEWIAGKYNEPTKWLDRDSPFMFVDQYNAEFNRGIQPMRGGYTDNYYMQMAQNIRKYKGARPIPQLKGLTKIKVNGSFDDWDGVDTEYRDTRADVDHRDELGYAKTHYVNTSGRNDIVTSKVAVDGKNVYFMVECDKALTSHTDPNWMLLMIDSDNNSQTGWYGYDVMINKGVKSSTVTSLMCYEGNKWVERAEIPYSYSGNKMEIGVPRKLLKLGDGAFTFDFKWSDNPSELTDPISFALNGDTAPNRRFNYRCIWSN